MPLRTVRRTGHLALTEVWKSRRVANWATAFDGAVRCLEFHKTSPSWALEAARIVRGPLHNLWLWRVRRLLFLTRLLNR